MSSVTSSLVACATAALALSLMGCGQQPLEVAPAGAASATETAVGPIPGSGKPLPVRSNPYENNPTAANEGYQFFSWYNCSGCHGVHGGGGMGPSLRDPVWIYGGSPDHVFASISQGRSDGMPSWGTKIPEQQIWKIVAYIKTMNTPSEIDPPTMPLATQQEHEASAKSAASSLPAPQP